MDNCVEKHDGRKYKDELIDLMRRIDQALCGGGIEYFGVFGTCLGAVREKNIIPWDDDIDIAVRRPDFRNAVALLSKSTEELYVCEEGFRRGRIFNRVSESDLLEKKRAYVDLYVIDYAPESRVHFMWNVLWYVGLSRIIWRRKGRLPQVHPCLYAIADFVALPFRVFSSKTLQRLAEWFYVYKKKTSVIKLSFDANRKRYPACIFEQSIRAQFGNITIMIPKGYDRYLEQC